MKLFGYFHKLKKRRLRRYVRVWQKASRIDPLDIFLVLKTIEYNQDKIPSLPFSGFVPAGMETYADVCLRQKIFNLLRNGDFSSRQRLLHVTDISHSLVLPLPNSWRQLLRDHGYQVNIPLSRLSFTWNVVVFYLKGGCNAFKMLFQTLATIGHDVSLKPYGMLLGLVPKQLPKTTPAKENRDFINWYRHWGERVPAVQDIWVHCHGASGPERVGNVRVITTRVPFPPLRSFGHAWSLIVDVVALVFQSGIGLLRGRWWWAVMLSDAVLASYGRLLNSPDWAHEYIFHNSNWIERPLWSYQAEAEGARILMLYYSVASWSMIPGRPLRILFGSGSGIATWPNYVLMSREQGQTILAQRQRDVPIFIDPLIGFTDSATALPNLPWERAVVVFDITPFRASWLAQKGMAVSYLCGKNMIRFLEVVAKLLSERNLVMVLKRKREINDHIVNTAYMRYIERIKKKSHIINIDPGISAQRVIERCVATISVPFTSTAVIANALKKPSVYWDPTGSMADVASMVHGVRVIDDEEALAQWLDQIVA